MTIRSLQTPGRQIVVLSDPPHQLVSGPICLAAHESNFKSCETTLLAARQVRRGLAVRPARTAATKTGATFVNVTPWFCDGNSCPLSQCTAPRCTSTTGT